MLMTYVRYKGSLPAAHLQVGTLSRGWKVAKPFAQGVSVKLSLGVRMVFWSKDSREA